MANGRTSLNEDKEGDTRGQQPAFTVPNINDAAVEILEAPGEGEHIQVAGRPEGLPVPEPCPWHADLPFQHNAEELVNMEDGI